MIVIPCFTKNATCFLYGKLISKRMLRILHLISRLRRQLPLKGKPKWTRTDKPIGDKFSRLLASFALKSPHLSAAHATQIRQKFIRLWVYAVYIEQIFRIDKAKNRSNMWILQDFLPMDIQIFANRNLIGSSPLRLD